MTTQPPPKSTRQKPVVGQLRTIIANVGAGKHPFDSMAEVTQDAEFSKELLAQLPILFKFLSDVKEYAAVNDELQRRQLPVNMAPDDIAALRQIRDALFK